MILNENERIDDLGCKNLKIIQNKNWFCFGIDSVLLVNFAKNIKSNANVLDLGTGTGIIPILLSGKTNFKKAIAVEVQENVSIETTQNTIENDYFASSRLEREKMYSQMLESYQTILESSEISDAQKEVSQTEINKINNTKNAIMIAENLLKTKDIEDIILLVNDKSINVVVKTDKLSQDKVAQIQNIVSREMNAEIDNIHITEYK